MLSRQDIVRVINQQYHKSRLNRMIYEMNGDFILNKLFEPMVFKATTLQRKAKLGRGQSEMNLV